ncbi:MAG: hypothetical protein PHU85_17975, partial [Phycisphaerae bacterium]|nr:hypothetical protein [Phycisphaerae bacterium]
MFKILLHCPDPTLRRDVQFAGELALDAVLPPTRRAQVVWLDTVPPDTTGLDLLLMADQPQRCSRLLDELRPRPTLAVLVLPNESAGAPAEGTLDPTAIAAADDLLLWPCSGEVMRARFEHFLRRIRLQRQADELDDRLTAVTRENSTLRRQAAKGAR